MVAEKVAGLKTLKSESDNHDKEVMTRLFDIMHNGKVWKESWKYRENLITEEDIKNWMKNNRVLTPMLILHCDPPFFYCIRLVMNKYIHMGQHAELRPLSYH